MGANCASCAQEEPGSCALVTDASCHCTLGAPAFVKTRLRVGCCAGMFDAPIQYAVSRRHPDSLDVSLSLIQCPPDAGAVMSMLSGGVVDLAVMHTEDAVAFAAEGNPLKLCGTFVATPRCWGVYASCCDVRDASDLPGGTIGMPDEKNAGVILSLLGNQPDWKVAWHCPRRHFLSMHRAADAMTKGLTCATVWERRPARCLAASGEWRLLGQAAAPWPDLVFVASTEALHAKAGTIRHFISFTHAACEDFRQDLRGEASQFLSARYGVNAETSREFLAETSWVCHCQVDPQTVLLPLGHLARVGIVDRQRAADPMKFLAKGCCLVDQLQALSPYLPRTPSKGSEKQPEDKEEVVQPVVPRPEAEPVLASPQAEVAASPRSEDVRWEPDEEHSPNPAG